MASADRPRIRVVLEFDPAEMARRGRIGGLRTHSRHDSRAHTQPARDAFLRRFEEEVDPGGALPADERRRRAEAARRAYFAELAHKSAKARRGKKAAPAPAARAHSPPARDAA